MGSNQNRQQKRLEVAEYQANKSYREVDQIRGVAPRRLRLSSERVAGIYLLSR